MGEIMDDLYDVAIIGAGPAGCSCALNLAKSNLKIAIFDKESFPRRKVCGGALSDRAMNVLKRMDKKLDFFQRFHQELKKNPSYGVRLFINDKDNIPFSFKSQSINEVPGYICVRSDFDNFLYKELGYHKNITIFVQTKVTDITNTGKCINIKSENHSLNAKFIIGADGANSLVAKNLSSVSSGKHLKVNYGMSAHYKKISGFHEDNLIDLYFLADLLPGYFWIFQLPDEIVNVGIMISPNTLKKQKLSIKELLNKVINDQPVIAKRLENAEIIDEPKGWTLPLSSNLFSNNNDQFISGNNYILIGDAASLIDPLSGEGIGNALLSGEVAADAILKCFSCNDFTAKKIELYYNNVIKKKLSLEILFRSAILKLFCCPFFTGCLFKLLKKMQFLRRFITKKLYKQVKSTSTII